MPLANKVDRRERELEECGSKLRLMWDFRNDEQTFIGDKFRLKSSFNLKNKRRYH